MVQMKSDVLYYQSTLVRTKKRGHCRHLRFSFAYLDLKCLRCLRVSTDFCADQIFMILIYLILKREQVSAENIAYQSLRILKELFKKTGQDV